MNEISLVSLDELIGHQEMQVRTQRFPDYKTPTKIPILLAGGVGDVIMGIPLAEQIQDFGEIEIYTAHLSTYDRFKPSNLPKGHAATMPPFTWFIEINTRAIIRTQEGFSGFPSESGIARLWAKQQAQFEKYPKLKTLCINHPLQDTSLARYARDLGIDRTDFASFSMGLKPHLKIRFRRETSGNYITIHDGYEAESAFIVPGRATKTWKWDHWNDLVRRLKAAYPDTPIIQLGTTTGRPIDGVDSCLLNKTTLPEAFDLLSKSKLHIDGDSGLVHVATALSVPCVALFGPTPDYFYGYPENKNLRSKHCAEARYWLTRDWLGKCPIGYRVPVCMDEIKPEEVFEAAQSFLT